MDHYSSTPHASFLLVRNSNVEHPPIEEELDIEVSGRVEDIDVANFTPSTMRRMREWLYGVAEPSLKFVDRFSFIKYYLPKYIKHITPVYLSLTPNAPANHPSVLRVLRVG